MGVTSIIPNEHLAVAPSNDPLIRVLLVEDEEADHHRLARALEKSSHQFDVERVASLADATRRLAVKAPDVVVLDLGLPDGDGLENLDAIQAIAPETPVVILTGMDDPELTVEALNSGAQDVVSKDDLNDQLIVKSLTYAIQRKLSEVRLRQGLDELQQAARIDPLTGLLNRRAFFALGNQLWSTACHDGKPLSCVMLDLDFFKRVNDIHGHLAGDEALASVARMLEDHSRAGDLVGRYGGEEFCVLLPNSTEEDAIVWAERIRAAVEGATVTTQRSELNLTISLGVASGYGDGDTLDGVLDRADQALLASKQRGRNVATQFTDLDDGPGVICPESTQHCIFRNARVRDYMTAPIRCLRADDTISSAAAQLLELGVNSLPVVDGEHRLVGIVSEKDLIEVDPLGSDWTLPIERVMCQTVVSFSADAPLRSARDFLARVSMRRVVVVEGHRPVGVLSRSNLLRYQLKWAASLADDAAELA